MIVDRMQNSRDYPLGKAWQLAFEFLISLKPDAEEKKYHLQGDDIFAMVMSYETRPPDTAALEAHRKYLDIQAVITGGEGIAWFPKDELIIKQLYDESKDVEFYQHPNSSFARINVFPGTFVALFPQDAHMPSLMLGNTPECTKKVVVKVNAKLLYVS
ncbi:MAG: YhcH/YjgK/YiaL family protein [Planctomycetes bacterium]|nr:YhcH/YjgK/YiaL family protein [Planctomycetota bacterium]